MDPFLKKSFGLDPKRSYKVIEREDVGKFVHIFNHIRLKVYVGLLVIQLRGEISDILPEEKKEVPWKCVEGKALASLDLTPGVKKVYLMVQKLKQSKIARNSPSERKLKKPRK
ncbi:unnamed protein product [Linum trigynum]|uniref:Uncharacterized protein n=1 Tax=Linum trigynum TaxID=586398 RepID=A0AAV2F4S0_9ROSI